MPQKKVAVVENKNLFSSHPLVSTLLYFFLGSNEASTIEEFRDSLIDNKNNEHLQSRTPPILSWKDDHGGHIAEYISSIQLQSSKGDENKARLQRLSNENTDIKDLSTLSSNLSPNLEKNQTQLNDEKVVKKSPKIIEKVVNNESIISHSPNKIEKEQYEKDTESPQWGFYVSITPPTEQHKKSNV